MKKGTCVRFSTATYIKVYQDGCFVVSWKKRNEVWCEHITFKSFSFWPKYNDGGK